MSDFSFILDNITFSFSGVSSFHTCPYGYKLTYIDGEDRIDNFYSDYGKFIHLILEKFFRDELEENELLSYYEDNYAENVKCSPPPYPASIGTNYYNDAHKFFETFEFDKSKYDVIIIEDAINSSHKNFNLVVKPDLVLRNIETGKCTLVDYKTSKYSTSKNDKKLIEYKKQMNLYAQFLWKEKQIEISNVEIWFIRADVVHSFDIDLNQVMFTLEWFADGVSKIKKENNWKPNNTKENKYFCDNLCGVRNKCIYRQS